MMRAAWLRRQDSAAVKLFAVHAARCNAAEDSFAHQGRQLFVTEGASAGAAAMGRAAMRLTLPPPPGIVAQRFCAFSAVLVHRPAGAGRP
jgi:hypothetical protein